MEKDQTTQDKKKGRFSLNSLNPIKSVIARGYYTALIAIIIVLITAYATTIPGSRKSLTEQAEGSLSDLSQSYIKILESRISTINGDMEYMNTQSDIYGCLVMNSEVSVVTAELKAFIRKNPDYLYAAIYDKDGKFVTASADGYSKDNNPYYVNAALSLKRAMQSDYIKVDGKDCVIFAMPLINSGNLMGCATITVPVEKFTSDLAAVKMEDMESSFAYLISPLGYFLYHPDSEYIGKITGEEVLRDVISQGNVVSAVAHFDGNIAGLATSETNGWTLVIQANTNELLKSVDDTVAKSVIFCIITALLISIVAYIAIYIFLHPIALMTKEITNISSLDFTSTKDIDKLTKQQTEIGTMAKEIKKMHVNLKSVISDLNDMTQKISSGSNELSDIATSLTDCSSENSAVSEELAAGMGQTADAVSAIKGEVDTIRKRTTEINRQSQSSIDLSSEIMGRAEGARQSVVEATNSTRSLYSKMSEDAHIALEQSKAVNKINDLTKNILDIAEQTSLLALNASIEAARSGKYGKGFAVVAKEISTLAQETSNTVTGIMSIVTEVTDAVNNLDSCLTRTLDFIDTSVMEDYDSFTGMSDAYRNDAKSFQITLTEIKNALHSLETATNDIVDAVYGIDSTIGESSKGVMTIADRSTEVVQLSDSTYNQVILNAQMSETLQGIVDKFKL